MQKKDLIKNNSKIRELLEDRLLSMGFTQKNIIDDAAGFDMRIDPAALSRYFKNEKKDSNRTALTQSQIIWLCSRYCIDVKVEVDLLEYNFKTAKKLIDEK